MPLDRVQRLIIQLVQIFSQVYPIWKTQHMKSKMGLPELDQGEYRYYSDLFNNELKEITIEDLYTFESELLSSLNERHKDFPPNPIYLNGWLKTIHKKNNPLPASYLPNKDIVSNPLSFFPPRAYSIMARGYNNQIGGGILPSFKCTQEEADNLDEKYKGLLDIVWSIRKDQPELYKASMMLQERYNAFRMGQEKNLGVWASKESVECAKKFFQNKFYFLSHIEEWGGKEQVIKILEFLQETELWPELMNLELETLLESIIKTKTENGPLKD